MVGEAWQVWEIKKPIQLECRYQGRGWFKTELKKQAEFRICDKMNAKTRKMWNSVKGPTKHVLLWGFKSWFHYSLAICPK